MTYILMSSESSLGIATQYLEVAGSFFCAYSAIRETSLMSYFHSIFSVFLRRELRMAQFTSSRALRLAAFMYPTTNKVEAILFQG
jgi:hypothetical protein